MLKQKFMMKLIICQCISLNCIISTCAEIYLTSASLPLFFPAFPRFLVLFVSLPWANSYTHTFGCRADSDRGQTTATRASYKSRMSLGGHRAGDDGGGRQKITWNHPVSHHEGGASWTASRRAQ